MDLTATWQEFKARPFQLSAKQQTLILDLAKKLKGNPITNKTMLLKQLSIYLKREVNTWENLKADDISKIIYILKSRQAPTKADLALVKASYSLQEVNQMLLKANPHHATIDGYDGLNHGQAQLLLGFKRRFKTQYNDHPLLANVDYEYGWQESPLCTDNKMYYLKFYELLMLDYDEITHDELIQILTAFGDDHYFEIHQTHNGYHVFLLSELLNHRDPQAKQLMIELKTDHYYMMFCYVNGYKIRLSKKLGRDESFISRFVGNFGNPLKLNPDCQKLLAIFHQHLKVIDDGTYLGY